MVPTAKEQRTMSSLPTGPTDEEHAEYIDSGEWEDSDFEFGPEVGGSVTVDFDHVEVDDLLKASDIIGERSTAFIKKAAMARIKEVLAEQSDRSAQSAAAGGD